MRTPATPSPGTPFRIHESQQREVDRLLADGLLEPLLPGVVGAVGSAAALDVRVVAAALALPDRVRERAVVAQAAAAWIWCGGAPPPVVDIVVAPGAAVPRLPAVVGHERRMPPQDVAVLTADGVQVAVTSATRTLVDHLRLLPEAQALPAVVPLAGLAGVTVEGIAACLERMPRARGVTRARLLATRLVLPPATAGPLPGEPPAQSMRLPVIR